MLITPAVPADAEPLVSTLTGFAAVNILLSELPLFGVSVVNDWPNVTEI